MRKLYRWIVITYYYLRYCCLYSINKDAIREVKVETPKITLETMRKSLEIDKRFVYLRFGDGDVNLARGRPDLYQEASSAIQEEIREAFQLFGTNVIKALPLHCDLFGSETGMKNGLFKSENYWAANLYSRVAAYFQEQKIYSPVALVYCSIFDENSYSEFISVIRSKNGIFVGNGTIDYGKIQGFLNIAGFIKTPSRNAYNEIDRIEMETIEALSNNEKKVVLLAMGCSGRVLAKRLWIKMKGKITIFDLGSIIDYIDGKNTRAWMHAIGKRNI